jgi:hypothetical protein
MYAVESDAKRGLLGWNILASFGVMYAVTAQSTTGDLEPEQLPAALNDPTTPCSPPRRNSQTQRRSLCGSPTQRMGARQILVGANHDASHDSGR